MLLSYAILVVDSSRIWAGIYLGSTIVMVVIWVDGHLLLVLATAPVAS